MKKVLKMNKIEQILKSDFIISIATFLEDEKLKDLVNTIKNILNNVDEIIDAIKHPKVYNFIHLPVQTGSNKVLSEMRRGAVRRLF